MCHLVLAADHQTNLVLLDYDGYKALHFFGHWQDLPGLPAERQVHPSRSKSLLEHLQGCVSQSLVRPFLMLVFVAETYFLRLTQTLNIIIYYNI